MMIAPVRLPMALVPMIGAAALVACASEEDRTYEADVTDESGGELIVTEETPAVDVELPETPMTPMPVDEAGDEEVAPE